MSVIIRLQNLPWSANAGDIRRFFEGLSIPDGGVHIVGGEDGDAFIAFSTDEDARRAMQKNPGILNNVQVKLFLSSKSEMQSVIAAARAVSNAIKVAPASSAPDVVQQKPSAPQRDQSSEWANQRDQSMNWGGDNNTPYESKTRTENWDVSGLESITSQSPDLFTKVAAGLRSLNRLPPSHMTPDQHDPSIVKPKETGVQDFFSAHGKQELLETYSAPPSRTESKGFESYSDSGYQENKGFLDQYQESPLYEHQQLGGNMFSNKPDESFQKTPFKPETLVDETYQKTPHFRSGTRALGMNMVTRGRGLPRMAQISIKEGPPQWQGEDANDEYFGGQFDENVNPGRADVPYHQERGTSGNMPVSGLFDSHSIEHVQDDDGFRGMDQGYDNPPSMAQSDISDRGNRSRTIRGGLLNRPPLIKHEEGSEWGDSTPVLLESPGGVDDAFPGRRQFPSIASEQDLDFSQPPPGFNIRPPRMPPPIHEPRPPRGGFRGRGRGMGGLHQDNFKNTRPFDNSSFVPSMRNTQRPTGPRSIGLLQTPVDSDSPKVSDWNNPSRSRGNDQNSRFSMNEAGPFGQTDFRNATPDVDSEIGIGDNSNFRNSNRDRSPLTQAQDRQRNRRGRQTSRFDNVDFRQERIDPVSQGRNAGQGHIERKFQDKYNERQGSEHNDQRRSSERNERGASTESAAERRSDRERASKYDRNSNNERRNRTERSDKYNDEKKGDRRERDDKRDRERDEKRDKDDKEKEKRKETSRSSNSGSRWEGSYSSKKDTGPISDRGNMKKDSNLSPARVSDSRYTDENKKSFSKEINNSEKKTATSTRKDNIEDISEKQKKDDTQQDKNSACQTEISRKRRREAETSTSVHITGLPVSVTFRDVRRFFTGCEIPWKGLKLINDKYGNRTGVAFVKFDSDSFAKQAMRRSGQIVNGSPVTVTRCSDDDFEDAVDSFIPPTQSAPDSPKRQKMEENKKEEKAKDETKTVKDTIKQQKTDPKKDQTRADVPKSKTNFCIQNLPSDAEENDLLEFFKPMKVKSVFLNYDRHGNVMSSGYVEFFPDTDTNGILKFNGRDLKGRKLTVESMQQNDMGLKESRSAKNNNSQKTDSPKTRGRESHTPHKEEHFSKSNRPNERQTESKIGDHTSHTDNQTSRAKRPNERLPEPQKDNQTSKPHGYAERPAESQKGDHSSSRADHVTGEDYRVKLHGIPFEAKIDDILNFCKGLDLVPGGTLMFFDEQGRSRDVAYIQLANEKHVDYACKRTGRRIGRRFINVSPISNIALVREVQRFEPGFNGDEILGTQNKQNIEEIKSIFEIGSRIPEPFNKPGVLPLNQAVLPPGFRNDGPGILGDPMNPSIPEVHPERGRQDFGNRRMREDPQWQGHDGPQRGPPRGPQRGDRHQRPHFHGDPIHNTDNRSVHYIYK